MACGAGRGLQPPPRHSVRSAARWACAGRCTFAGSCERAQRPVAPAGGRPATAHLTATLDGHGATKNASSQRASVAEPPPFSPLSSRTHGARSCARTRLLSTCLQKEKKAHSCGGPAQPSPVDLGERRARAGFYPVRPAIPPLRKPWGTRRWAALGHQVRAPQTALLGPWAAAWPSGLRLSVGIAPIAMGGGLAGHGAASRPSSGSGKRSGRGIRTSLATQSH